MLNITWPTLSSSEVFIMQSDVLTRFNEPLLRLFCLKAEPF